MSDNIELRRKQNDYICHNLPDNILPISPVKMFECEDDDSRRGEILQVCYDLIDMCDEAWFYNYNGLSDGQKKEYCYWLNRLKLSDIYYVELKQPPKRCIQMEKEQYVKRSQTVNEGWI